MKNSQLSLHKGARIVSLPILEAVPTPEPTETWFPVGHAECVVTVAQLLRVGGYHVDRAEYALNRGDTRMFATLDLTSALCHGVGLSVGIRNAIDHSLALGFAAGSRVFVCDNLAFNAELVVTKKHTKNGRDRFRESIAGAVGALPQFVHTESQRILTMQVSEATDERAESIILRACERGIVSTRLVWPVLNEWRASPFQHFQGRNLWSLFNAFTGVLGKTRAMSNPRRFADATLSLSGLFDEAMGITIPAPTAGTQP